MGHHRQWAGLEDAVAVGGVETGAGDRDRIAVAHAGQDGWRRGCPAGRLRAECERAGRSRRRRSHRGRARCARDRSTGQGRSAYEAPHRQQRDCGSADPSCPTDTRHKLRVLQHIAALDSRCGPSPPNPPAADRDFRRPPRAVKVSKVARFLDPSSSIRGRGRRSPHGKQRKSFWLSSRRSPRLARSGVGRFESRRRWRRRR